MNVIKSTLVFMIDADKILQFKIQDTDLQHISLIDSSFARNRKESIKCIQCDEISQFITESCLCLICIIEIYSL